jgi:fucose permease
MAFLERRFVALYAALFSIFILFGASMTLVGAILPRIFTDFHWSYVQAGVVLAGGSVGLFVGTYIAGRALRALGVRTLLLAALVLDAVGLAFFGLSPSVLLNFVLYFAVGLGQGFMEVGVDWSTVRMSGEGDARPMSLVHGAFSIGAMIAPLVVGILLVSQIEWSYAYRAVAGLFLALVIAVLFLPFDRLGRDERSQEHGESLIKNPAYWLGFAVLFLYVGVEIGVSNWCAEYFVRVFGRGPETAALMVSLFWGGMLAGRLGIPLFLPKAKTGQLLVVLSMAFALSVGLLLATGLVGSAAFWLGVAAILLTGLTASCIYPSAMTLAGQAFPNHQGPAIGFAATGGAVGCFVFPFAMSGISSGAGLVAGFGFYALIAILGAAAAIALASVVHSRAAGQGSE